ncbi:reverse transcriptase [Elysia marginata]|uniref:Reverse transcriptase n=1 Tax=Elysia marginata TaxID=1093978 RepID=A0AAV4FFL5_9GAST|nr:reverse transcriptase [Elysia marginata]
MELKGEELRKWVDKRVAEMREKEKEEREAQKDKEREERTAQRGLKKLEKELEKLRVTSQQLPAQKIQNAHSAVHKIKLPPFGDRVDEIDAYIFRFEVHALKYWPDDEWANYFISLLRGRALTYFGELSSEETLNYETLKSYY